MMETIVFCSGLISVLVRLSVGDVILMLVSIEIVVHAIKKKSDKTNILDSSTCSLAKPRSRSLQ